MFVLGIDVGITGGLVTLNMEREILFKSVMPIFSVNKGGKNKTMIDIPELKDNLIHAVSFGKTICYLEKVASMPGQGVVSVFGFGHTAGILEGLLVGLNIPYKLVPPQTWCKVMHSGIDKSIDAKKRSQIVLKREFPNLDLRATDRCLNPHLGMMDALLIAEYGRCDLGGKNV